jgi:acetoin:2,6-dichlorophenolindophenol oxidoreductase subunit alpha
MKEGLPGYRYDPQDPAKTIPTMSVSGLGAAEALQLYEFMVRLRRIEEALINEYHPADEMRCPVHFCVGQESVPAALSLLLRRTDPLFSHHRSHGYYYAKGGDSRRFFAELYGKSTGTNGGLGGSQGLSVPDLNFFTGAILTGGVALAAGSGLSIKMSADDRCAVAGFGEAATDQGIFSLHRLPVVLVCENNLYSTYSPQVKRCAGSNISERVETFGVETRTIFGNDVVSAYNTLKEAFERVRSGAGPAFVEAYTYRWNGHVGPEDDDYIGYRDPAEIAFWKRHCPIRMFEEKLLASGVLSDTRCREISRAADEEVDDAFRFAKESPPPQAPSLEALNAPNSTPVADRLLRDEDHAQFNGGQDELVPGPY